MAGRALTPATRRRLGGPLPHQQADRPRGHPVAADHFLVAPCGAARISGISHSFPWLFRSTGQVPHVLLTRSPVSPPRKADLPRLACVRRAASVRPEPGSNSPLAKPTTVDSAEEPPCHGPPKESGNPSDRHDEQTKSQSQTADKTMPSGTRSKYTTQKGSIHPLANDTLCSSQGAKRSTRVLPRCSTAGSFREVTRARR